MDAKYVKLGVNIDHIATLREARKTNEPDPVAAAILAEMAGADGITVHLRGDRRHIQERDVRLLRDVITTRLNVEMATNSETIKLITAIKPDTATLVPERREEITTEGGLDVVMNASILGRGIVSLQDAGIAVSIFVDPDLDQIKACQKTGARKVEINTGKYADAKTEELQDLEWEKVRNACQLARRVGFQVLAGHGLTYHNVSRIVQIEEIVELNIGHNIVSRASLVGLERAVREMKALLIRG
ncbi:pyridoxine 5'-phosphate synthase [bacterium]|nr:pyridoxine 5'-phosphate synthase [bacterium]MCI0603904.1 pyridoxine 5'-phosphate synthase [bacterium]